MIGIPLLLASSLAMSTPTPVPMENMLRGPEPTGLPSSVWIMVPKDSMMVQEGLAGPELFVQPFTLNAPEGRGHSIFNTINNNFKESDHAMSAAMLWTVATFLGYRAIELDFYANHQPWMGNRQLLRREATLMTFSSIVVGALATLMTVEAIRLTGRDRYGR